MNVIRDIQRASPVEVTEVPEGLSAILRPDCAAIAWSRAPSDDFQHWIDALPPEQLPKARTILRPEDVAAAVTQICNLCETPNCAERAMLVDDTAALAHIFSQLMQSEYLLLRLDVVQTNKCRKFHIDAIRARLICTYRGTGTQYGVPADGPEPEHISTVPTGSPIVLRGTHWPERPRAGLLHRSPPIEGTGETRLVLVLDPVVDPEKHPHRQLIH